MTSIAIIPARGGSRRIPRKNVKPFHGRPIIEYSIEAAQESGLFDSIFVSTDDEETMEIARRMGCYIHLRSTAYLCGDEAGTQAVAQDCLMNSTSGADMACCIYATAPLMTAEDLRVGFEIYFSNPYQYVYVTGWYYFGDGDAFLLHPAIGAASFQADRLVGERWIDINTEEDWMKAEKMYASVRERSQIDSSRDHSQSARACNRFEDHQQ